MQKCLFAMRHGLWATPWLGRHRGTSSKTEVHRRRSLADLAETLYDIQTEMEDKRIEQQQLRDAQRRAKVWELSIDEQRGFFAKSEALRRQIVVLGKSERSVRTMMQSIDERAEIERVRRMLERTLEQQAHQDVEEHRAEGRELLEQVDAMSQYMDQSHEAMESIAQIANLDADATKRLHDSKPLELLPEFISWQNEVRGCLETENVTVKPACVNRLVEARA